MEDKKEFILVKNTRDLMALLCLIIVIPALWAFDGLGWIHLPETVLGATIMGWTLILKAYIGG
jgi:hypothetical protein